jgi:hypothetical protein
MQCPSVPITTLKEAIVNNLDILLVLGILSQEKKQGHQKKVREHQEKGILYTFIRGLT